MYVYWCCNEWTVTRVITRWAIFGDHIDIQNLNSSFKELNNDILTLSQMILFQLIK